MYRCADEHRYAGSLRLSVEQLRILPPVLVLVVAVSLDAAALAKPDRFDPERYAVEEVVLSPKSQDSSNPSICLPKFTKVKMGFVVTCNPKMSYCETTQIAQRVGRIFTPKRTQLI